MGQEFEVRCNKCGYVFEACLGIGMTFPAVYEENVKRMKCGKLGLEAKAFFEQYLNGVINSEQVVARCKECGNYDVVDDLTMYIPKENANIPDEVGYVFAEDIKESYVKYMDYPHKCSECGGSSKVYKSFEKKAYNGTLKCPKCDGMMGLNLEQLMMWD